jgi:hypothetical protein
MSPLRDCNVNAGAIGLLALTSDDPIAVLASATTRNQRLIFHDDMLVNLSLRREMPNTHGRSEENRQTEMRF